MTTPSKSVENFITQACSLFVQHSKYIEELRILEQQNANDSIIKRKYNDLFWNAVCTYRNEHKNLCENFGFKINNNNFDMSCYTNIIIYNNHEVIYEEIISPKKVKVFTKNLKDNDVTLVFYCELKQDKWAITKLRKIDEIDEQQKEYAPWCW
jgi:hypothetical protein